MTLANTKPVPSTDQSLAIAAARALARERLAPFSDTPSLDAQVLLAHVTGRTRAWVLAHPEGSLTEGQQRAFLAALARLESSVPLPYVLGEWEFFGLSFIVNPHVLIPRPETELLVETALAWLEANPTRRAVADVGTGSGCIAVSLAVNIPDLWVTASDISLPASRVARSNAGRHHVQSRIHFVHADLLHPLSGPFDLICANLPYIPTATLQKLDVYQREPASALDGGLDGLGHISRLLVQGGHILAPGGLMLLEIDASQGEAAAGLSQKVFPQAEVEVLPDLAGHPRLLAISP